MLSVSGINWEEIPLNKRIIEKINVDYNFPDIVSKIIISKSFNQEEIESVKNNIKISNPFLNKMDFIRGLELLNQSIERKEKIFVLGDYDVDGCVSTSLFVNFLKKLTHNISYYIPDRIRDGYGPTPNLINRILKKKPELIIMVDCGSNSKESINILNKNNINTLIIDHHEIYKPYPKSKILINPKKECDYNQYDYFSAATLTYFFIDSYIRKFKLKINFKRNLIYVLLSIITDVMPLRKTNRIIAINVLKNFNLKDNFIINKIFELKKLKKKFEIDDLGFLIGPILNSAGRLDNPNKVIELMITKNDKKKEKIIKELLLLNEKRKIIESNILTKFDYSKIRKLKENVIILCENNLNEGLIGIIASRIKEYFNKPCAVLTNSGTIYKGSARSTQEFNFGAIIKKAIDLDILVSGGGHNLAAGFTIKKEKIPFFKDFLNKMYLNKSSNSKKSFLSKISTHAINDKFFNQLQQCSPFGSENSNPLFLIEKIKVIKPIIQKDRYISCYIKSKSGKLLSAICFEILDSNLSRNLLNNKNEIDLIVQLKENNWNNRKKLQLIIVDMLEISNKA